MDDARLDARRSWPVAPRRARLAAALVFLGLGPAAAQDPVDLAAAAAPARGERVWVEERFRALERFDVLGPEGDVLYHHERVRGHEAQYVEEVLAVSGGAPVDVRRSYAGFVDLAEGEAEDVEGLVLRVRRGSEGGAPDVEVEAGEAPRSLLDALSEEPAPETPLLLPARPVAPDAAWDLDLDDLSHGLGLTAALDREASRARGTFTGATLDERGRSWLGVDHEVRLVCERFQGMACGDPPVVVSGEGGARIASGGPGLEAWLEVTVQGRTRPPLAPGGVAVDLDGRLERRIERRALD